MPQKRWKKASIYSMEHEHICDVSVEVRREYLTLVFPKEIQEGSWEDVNAVFYDDEKGLVTYVCKLSDYKHRSDRLTAKCVLGEEQGAVQRRNDLKIRQIIPISIQTTDTAGKKINVDGTIQDISAGGIFFVSEHIFNEGDQFSFLFRRTARPLRLECKVLRRQPYEGRGNFSRDNMMGYGCKFINLRDNQEAAIRSYIFKEDLLKRRREREMMQL